MGSEEQDYIDLRDFFGIIRKRAGIIAVITIMALAASAVVSFFVLPEIYETSTTLIVSKQKQDTTNNKNTDTEYSDVMMSQQLVKSYSIIAKSDRVLQSVIDQLGLNMKLKDLRDEVKVTSQDQTEIIKISVDDQDPAQAQKIANTLADIFKDQVKSIMLMDNVQVIDEASLPLRPVKPKKMMNIAIAGIAGVVVGCGIAFMLEYMDNTIKKPEDIDKYLKLPVLGTIPDFEE